MSPINMVLHCPACGLQHVDAPFKPVPGDGPEWTNPPHRSHLCHGCGHIWRPADVATNGVLSVKTVGKDDSPIARPPAPIPLDIIRFWPDGFQERLEKVWRDLVGFIPNYKLHDLQRVLAEFGLRMEVYEDQPKDSAVVTQPRADFPL